MKKTLLAASLAVLGLSACGSLNDKTPYEMAQISMARSLKQDHSYNFQGEMRAYLSKPQEGVAPETVSANRQAQALADETAAADEAITAASAAAAAADAAAASDASPAETEQEAAAKAAAEAVKAEAEAAASQSAAQPEAAAEKPSEAPKAAPKKPAPQAAAPTPVVNAAEQALRDEEARRAAALRAHQEALLKEKQDRQARREAVKLQAQQEAQAAKEAKNWAEADRIRQSLLQQGVVLKDSPTGTTWEMAL